MSCVHPGQLCVRICVLEEPWPIQTAPEGQQKCPQMGCLRLGKERNSLGQADRRTEEIHHAYVINMICGKLTPLFEKKHWEKKKKKHLYESVK